ncbi:S8/S53 family peptidase [Halovulum sp. GXIMD14794]
MSKVRTVLRKRIIDEGDLQEVLDTQDKDPEKALGLCRGFARPKARSRDDALEDIAREAPTWGYLQPEGDPEKVRAGLVSPSCLLTRVLGPKDKRTSGKTADPSPDQKSPETVDTDYLEELFEVEFDSLTDEEQRSLGVDQPISPVDAYFRARQYWTTGKNGAPGFGDATQAMRLIGADWVGWPEFQAPAGQDGDGVNVVIVDEGFNLDYLRQVVPGLNYGGGFIDRNRRRPLPGKYVNPFEAPQNSHGNMIARNILRIAPKVRLFDAPVLPSQVTDIDAYTYDVEQLYIGILREALFGPYAGQPWVLVNAWSVANTIEEWDSPAPPAFRYSDGPLHPLNLLMQLMGFRFDIVFAAGNYGEFDPATLSGIYDRGPERSIRGSNALSNVLCVGACDMTGNWAGASSQGDGPQALKYDERCEGKPDLVTPSWFAEPGDPGTVSTGTSASCAVAAGVVAALRTRDPGTPPRQLFQHLRDTALRPDGEGWNNRTGMGILQVPQQAMAASA